ncbi:MAG: DNA gyrase subunit A [bacterium]
MTGEKIVPITLEEEMRNSYLDYSMSVIVSRALPDVRDGLKPSQRRILVAMNDLNLSPGAQHRKCAKIAGDASGNYHPHGEQVIYPTLVRMAQDFNLRYPLIDGQGNFGSVDGDPPAAMRYTEARLAHPAVDLLDDLEKETVDFVPNYDGTRDQPTVLPSRFPNLITNGCSGIAVGMATNIPPHNLTEIADATIALIDNPEIEIKDLMRHVKGPDFPTGAILYGRQGIRDAYMTGRGRLLIRARANIETTKAGKDSIIVTEIPFQVNKSALIERIADLVRDGDIEGIRDIRDESDREGMRIVIDMKSTADPRIVLNQLYQKTQMQDTFGVIMLALVNNRPRVLTLKEILAEHISHREVVIRRRTKFDLEKAERRAHILEGLKIALANIDAVIELIKKSANVEDARAGLMKTFKLSELQANAILEMRLQRLTGLEREKIEQEYLEVIKLIEELRSILSSREKVLGLIKDELRDLKKRYGDARRTEIVDDAGTFDVEDLIAEESMVITITHSGYIKRLPVTTYKRQNRGGRGVQGMGVKEEDFVEHLFIASTHEYILFFSNLGRVYWVKVHEIPAAGRVARGKAIVNLLEMQKDESVSAFMPVKEFSEEKFLVLATKKGMIKKTKLSEYSHPRRGGINAIVLKEGDELIEAAITDGTNEIILAKRGGKAIRFKEETARTVGRVSQGVTGTDTDGDEGDVVGMVVVKRAASLLVVTEKGFGKRTEIDEYRLTGRGGKGVLTLKTTDRNGPLVSIHEVVDSDELMIISKSGVLIRLPIANVSMVGRNTQGVKLIKLDEGDQVVGVARVVKEDDAEVEGGAGEADAGGADAGDGDGAGE